MAKWEPWPKEKVAQLLALHAQGKNDSQIAAAMGLPRATVNSYRNHILKLPNNGRDLGKIGCKFCSEQHSPLYMRKHLRLRHGVVMSRRTKNKSNADLYKPNAKGDFDSHGLLDLVVSRPRNSA